ncbi:hypothetical protein ACQEXU_21175 [Vibrio sp. TRT 21S02]|uniref:AbiU2 domain-containing protein n=1 Tax=Vibrio sp. TRT 21S02 TaxID=3418507 RepID=UPI003CEC0912
MVHMCAKLARLEPGVIDEPLGVDDLILHSVHQRAYVESINSILDEKIKSSYLVQSIIVGSTYSIIMSIMKAYDRQTRKEEINTLRNLLTSIEKNEMSTRFLSEFDTENTNSVFEPLKAYRDKSLAHNEKLVPIKWSQVDSALVMLVTVWSYVERYSDSRIMFPFYDFETVSTGLDRLLSSNDFIAAKQGWDSYMSEIKSAYENGKCL